MLLTCSYRGQEFVRVGYFVNNDYTDPELRENPPAKPLFDKLTRNILASKPRVTRFKINWDDSNGTDEINMEDGGEGSNEFYRNNEGHELSMDHHELNSDAQITDGISSEARLNENSNSLVMEC